MKKVKKLPSQPDEWKKLYKSESEKYKQYLETTQITNLSDLAQKLSTNISNIQILTDY